MTLVDALFATATLLASAQQPTGSWSSPSCFARDYRRDLVLQENGTFRSSDIPHPCAGECAAQSVYTRIGTWKLTNGIVRFTIRKTEGRGGGEAKAAAPLPAELRFDDKKHQLIEDGSKGPCVYAST